MKESTLQREGATHLQGEKKGREKKRGITRQEDSERERAREREAERERINQSEQTKRSGRMEGEREDECWKERIWAGEGEAEP